MASQIVRIFDTTLRDGEQSPGASMQKEEKLLVARQLARLGVDVIEAGFPVASPDDFSAVAAISKEIQDGPVICALARAIDRDITVAAEALSGASRGRIHTFIATSALHMEKKLKMSQDQVLKNIFRAVSLAKGHGYEVEFSAEDATRSEPDFLLKAVTCAIEAGATIINLPDTVGYAVPSQISEMFGHLISRVPGAGAVVFSCHCHDDLGLSVANSLAAIEAGARQVECTINGIGERAGNAALEEIVMALKVRKHHFGVETTIRTEEFTKTSRTRTQRECRKFQGSAWSWQKEEEVERETGFP